jgi:3-oxoacyl-[acyl-carrier-protein] synthase-3
MAMGTIIEASAAATAHRRPHRAGSLKLAESAATLCLERADRTADQVDLLINVGIYHDEILSEPAFASLIQDDIRANRSSHSGVGHGTFSFDVSNGACGMLTAIQLIDGMLSSGTVELGMVVASDMDPQPGISEGFAFPAAGGAILLRADDSHPGFTAFRFATFPEFADLFEGYVDWHEDARRGLAHHGRNILTVTVAESYAARALECAESSVRELASTDGFEFGEVGLLVATASIPGFADDLATALGVSGGRVAALGPDLVQAHTAAPALALESVALAQAGTTLFVSVGAGISVAAALYRA